MGKPRECGNVQTLFRIREIESSSEGPDGVQSKVARLCESRPACKTETLA